MARRFKAAQPDAPGRVFAHSAGAAPVSHPDLVREIHSLIASEVRARGVQLVLSPVTDAARTLSIQELRPA